VLLLAAVASAHQPPHHTSHYREYREYTESKALESCVGKDTVNKLTIAMKKAVARCQQTDAPELDLPPYRSMYKFVNTIITAGDNQDRQKLQQIFRVLMAFNRGEQGPDYRHQSDYSTPNWLQRMWNNYKQDNIYRKSDYGVYNNYNMEREADQMYEIMRKVMNNQQDYSNDEYEMMKMMMEFSNKQESGNYYDLMQQMQKFQQHDGHRRFTRQTRGRQGGSTKPVPASQALDRGDRLFAKLEEQKEDQQNYIGNLTCILRENKVLNRENQIDIRAFKQHLKEFQWPSQWFTNKYEELAESCHEIATSLPAYFEQQQNIQGDFGTVNMAQVHTFTQCVQEGRQRLCMDQDTKNKVESNFGPIQSILQQTGLTEQQLFPLVRQMLRGEQVDYQLWIPASYQ